MTIRMMFSEGKMLDSEIAGFRTNAEACPGPLADRAAKAEGLDLTTQWHEAPGDRQGVESASLFR